jgi:hypothetical protein
VARHGIRTAGEHRGQPSSLLPRVWAADGVDAGVHRVQAAVPQPPHDRVLADGEREELAPGDDAVLTPGEAR